MASIRISEAVHRQMKTYMKGEHGEVQACYEEAAREWMAKKANEAIILDSNVERMISERIGKVDNHLASMIARSGMDISMILMGLIRFLSLYIKDTSVDEIMKSLRHQGAQYYAAAIKKDKQDKKDNGGSTAGA